MRQRVNAVPKAQVPPNARVHLLALRACIGPMPQAIAALGLVSLSLLDSVLSVEFSKKIV